jgi:hypothetical protein
VRCDGTRLASVHNPIDHFPCQQALPNDALIDDTAIFEESEPFWPDRTKSEADVWTVSEIWVRQSNP